VFNKVSHALSKEKLGAPIFYFVLGMIILNIGSFAYWLFRFIKDVSSPPKRSVRQVKTE